MAQKTFSINDFITMDGNGVSKRDYADIVRTLLAQYRSIYGIDIDLDPRSADGRFIYDVATIIDSGLEIIQQLYTQLDPNKATGVFLDVLCSLTNVHRLSASSSTASVVFTQTSTNPIILSDDQLNLSDDSGNIWHIADDSGITEVTIPSASITQYYVYNGKRYESLTEAEAAGAPNTLSPQVETVGGKSEPIPYQCETEGRVSTSAFVFQIANGKQIGISIETIDLGSEEETDISLKNRRADSSSFGYTLAEGLRGALLNVYGVKDALIYSNDGSSGTLTRYLNNKSFDMPSHSIAVLVRKVETYTPDGFSRNVATTIDNYLTPSVSTKQDGFESYSFVDSGTNIVYSVYYGLCKKVAPVITITMRVTDSYVSSSDDIIAKAITAYLDNLPIDTYAQTYSLCNVVQNADPKSNGNSTLMVNNVAIEDNKSVDLKANNGCYYYYGIDYTVTGTTDDHIRTITIKEKDE